MKPLLSSPKDRSPVFFCSVCETAYATEKEAHRCELTISPQAQHPEISVGSVVLLPHHRYYWHERDEWIGRKVPANPKSHSHFDHRDAVVALWVVTCIEADAQRSDTRGRYFEDNRRHHRAIVSIASLAYCAQSDKPTHAWTTYRDHYSWEAVPSQESHKKLVEQVKHLLNKSAVHLL